MTAEPLDLDALLRHHRPIGPAPGTGTLCACHELWPCPMSRLLEEFRATRAALAQAEQARVALAHALAEALGLFAHEFCYDHGDGAPVPLPDGQLTVGGAWVQQARAALRQGRQP